MIFGFKPSEKQENFKFMRDKHAAVLSQTPQLGHWILWSAALFIVIFLTWAAFANLDEITRGPGKVISSKDTQVIQNLEGGILKNLLVAEGQTVTQGQVLMEIDDTQFASNLKESDIKRATLQAKISRLQGEILLQEPKFSEDLQKNYASVVADETALYQARKQGLAAKINIINDQINEKNQELKEAESRQQQYTSSLDLLQKELNLTIPLVKQGAVSEVEKLRLERSANDVKGDLATVKETITKLKSALSAEQKKIEEANSTFKIDAQQDLNAANAEFATLSETSEALQDRVERTLVRSPVKGIINQINIKTIGGIIKPGQDIIEIVPLEDSLFIEAEISPSDIGFLRHGLRAIVKLTAYDFSIYGGLEGQVEQISPDTVLNDKKENVYLVTIRTDKNYLERNGKKLQIIPGMRASVEIVTGQKTVLDYLLKPILKAKQEALTER